MEEFKQPPRKIPIRRTDTEKVQVGDPLESSGRYYDQNMEMTVVKLMTGDCYVTADPREMLVTILGSCISVCIRDPLAKVAGMNHILLPGDAKQSRDESGFATRFGVFAMEELINGLLKLGGHKSRFEVKIFGGGNVLQNSTATIGDKNIHFVKGFLRAEGIKIISEDVGGDWARRLHFFPDTGKAMIRKLQRKEDMVILDKEKEYAKKIIQKPAEPEVDLF
jgi:chemotaxis protein CheD